MSKFDAGYDFRLGMRYGFDLALAAVRANEGDCRGSCEESVAHIRDLVTKVEREVTFRTGVDHAALGVAQTAACQTFGEAMTEHILRRRGEKGES